MENKLPIVSIDILVIRNNKILLGLLSKDWLYEGKQVYGVPGREIHFRETMGQAVKRNIKEELNCELKEYKIISINANYALAGHYIGIGIVAEIDGEVELMKKDDWDTWKWFGKENIPTNLFPPAKNLIDSYFQGKFTVSE